VWTKLSQGRYRYGRGTSRQRQEHDVCEHDGVDVEG
jgi:hypothetical protein